MGDVLETPTGIYEKILQHLLEGHLLSLNFTQFGLFFCIYNKLVFIQLMGVNFQVTFEIFKAVKPLWLLMFINSVFRKLLFLVIVTYENGE